MLINTIFSKRLVIVLLLLLLLKKSAISFIYKKAFVKLAAGEVQYHFIHVMEFFAKIREKSKLYMIYIGLIGLEERGGGQGIRGKFYIQLVIAGYFITGSVKSTWL